jgi:hypothetical protein
VIIDVKAKERATRAELRAMGVQVRSDALGQAAIDLAKRLDADPGDRAAAMLTRELRLVIGDLHRRSSNDLGGELERFLGQISNPAFRGPGQ